MGILLDGRPTLASWPKRIYDWKELPGPFRPALEEWRAQGLPPGNVTYIPRAGQYLGGEERATAWWGGEALLLTARQGGTDQVLVRPGEVVRTRYTVQLLRCGAEVVLDRPGGAVRTGFFYNKTKEDQLFPVLALLLGQPPDLRPRQTHPETQALAQLREDSFAMYHTAKLCYRFGDTIEAQLWLRGRNYGLQRLRKQRPEWFLALMDRGAVAIRTDFYGSETTYLPWARLARAEVGEADFSGPGPRHRRALVLWDDLGEPLAVPLLPEQEERVAAFAQSLTARLTREET